MLPVIIAEADGDHLLVTVSGAKDTAERVARTDLGQVLARLVADLGVPTRLEIREADGRVLVDILDPPHTPDEDEEPASEDQGEGEADASGLVEISGRDFTPGEAVAAAVVLRHTSADGDGVASLLVDPALLPGGGGAEVVLVGRISQTVTVRPLT
ncbi:hypothetical protein I6I57_13640 [Brevibacterium casei]|uniref:Uncharacterized protein n=1 Tax=Brevibacterium ammoniilyticum TaxID=1046555 RepID=A0ABP9U1U4_9MICO|nr:hypothetical protein [Brevibacterium casei]QQT68738.1 hypothetical protein I6I57_13640 [Brevibacterium casei]